MNNKNEQQSRIDELEQALENAQDAILVHKIMYESFLSVKRCGTWFGIYQGDDAPKNDDEFLAYEINLLDALKKAQKKIR